jgi:HAD superfamily hydrolase (TIGR01458 family)
MGTINRQGSAMPATSGPRLVKRPKAVLIDLAGVLHVGDRAIDGAVDALTRLRTAGIPLRFLTNTTRTPRRTIVAKLRNMGFAVDEDELQTAPHAAQQLVRQRGLQPLYLIHPDLADELGPSADAPDAVVMGDMGPFLDYAQLNAAFRLLMAGKPFIAMAKNRYFMEEDGLSLDMGAFVTGLEFSSGTQAEVVGKPAAAFFHNALAELGVAPGDAAVVGDDLHDDVGAALAAGIAAILVRTGKFRRGDDADPAVRPTLVADDFAAAVDCLLALD